MVEFLSSRIKGIGFSFPSVSFMPDQISSQYPQLNPQCKPNLHLVLGNRGALRSAASLLKSGKRKLFGGSEHGHARRRRSCYRSGSGNWRL